MKNACYNLLSTWLLWFMAATQCWGSNSSSTTNAQHSGQKEGSCEILCRIEVVGFVYDQLDGSGGRGAKANAGGEFYVCSLQNDLIKSRARFRINLPPSFVATNEEELGSVEATVCISKGTIDRHAFHIEIADDAQVELVHGTSRKLQREPISGTRTILAIQLTTSFLDGDGDRRTEDPGMSLSEIEGSVFGTGSDAPGHDVVSQYTACSFGALTLLPAQGSNIENGVARVGLRTPIRGGEILGSLQDEIIEATEERVGSLDQFDFVIYCIPDDALMDGNSEWTAFTYFSSHWSFFQRRRCSAMSVTIHELGHNLGFRHSGFESEAYGDESGYMGFTEYTSGKPLKCFNGHKNYLSGWFKDRELLINPEMPEPVVARLVAFVDYDKPMQNNDVVLMRVGKYYIQYNRAKGMNADTGMHANQVSITYSKDHFSDSEAIVGLNSGQLVKLSNYRNTGYSLVVQVCEFGTESVDSEPSTVAMAREAIFGSESSSSSFIDFAWVSVYLQDGDQDSQCYLLDDLTAEPTTYSPTFQPTFSPSVAASESPSTRPQPTRTTPPERIVSPITTAQAPMTEPAATSSAPTTAPAPISAAPVAMDLIADLDGHQEKIQKRKFVPSVKDTNRLVQDEVQSPAKLRGLKRRDG